MEPSIPGSAGPDSALLASAARLGAADRDRSVHLPSVRLDRAGDPERARRIVAADLRGVRPPAPRLAWRCAAASPTVWIRPLRHWTAWVVGALIVCAVGGPRASSAAVPWPDHRARPVPRGRQGAAARSDLRQHHPDRLLRARRPDLLRLRDPARRQGAARSRAPGLPGVGRRPREPRRHRSGGQSCPASAISCSRSARPRTPTSVEVEEAGFWRIAGGFSEASAFGSATLACLAFSFAVLADQPLPARAPADAGAPAPCSSFPHRAPPTRALPSSPALRRCRWPLRPAGALVPPGPPGPRLRLDGAHRRVCRSISSTSDLFDPLVRLFEAVVLNKAASGRPRCASTGMSRACRPSDTFGLGVGLGSSRASSWLVAVVSQLGISGAAADGGARGRAAARSGWPPRPQDVDRQNAGARLPVRAPPRSPHWPLPASPAAPPTPVSSSSLPWPSSAPAAKASLPPPPAQGRSLRRCLPYPWAAPPGPSPIA